MLVTFGSKVTFTSPAGCRGKRLYRGRFPTVAYALSADLKDLCLQSTAVTLHAKMCCKYWVTRVWENTIRTLRTLVKWRSLLKSRMKNTEEISRLMWERIAMLLSFWQSQITSNNCFPCTFNCYLCVLIRPHFLCLFIVLGFIIVTAKNTLKMFAVVVGQTCHEPFKSTYTLTIFFLPPMIQVVVFP